MAQGNCYVLEYLNCNLLSAICSCCCSCSWR